MSVDRALAEGLSIGSLAGSVQTVRVIAADIRRGNVQTALTEEQRHDLADELDRVADLFIERAPPEVAKAAGQLIDVIMGVSR